MSNVIKSGTGNGKLASVDDSNRLQVRAYSEAFQHTIADEDQQAYQVIGEATLSSGTVTPLIITNNNADNRIVVTYIRTQVVGSSGGTALPDSGNYFSIDLGGSYTSGGTVATPVNTTVSSGNLPIVTAYQGDPTVVAGSTVDKWFPVSDGDKNSFNKEGSIIIRQGQSIQFNYTGDQTSGTVYVRLSFVMMQEHD